MSATLVPGYGRDYNNAKEVRAAWDAGKDFLIDTIGHPFDGRMINNEDAAREGGIFTIRYNKLRKAHVIKIKKKNEVN